MTLSEEMLMAFADGELEASACASVEQAMREDPQIAQRVARHRALRERLQGAFAAELQQPVPARLLAAARNVAPQSAHKVSSMQEVRNARATKVRLNFNRRPLTAMAASVLLGLGLGFALFRQGDAPLIRAAGGVLVAHGELDRALSNQLAAGQARDSSVRLGVSFLAKVGDYCRTFSLLGSGSTAGIACRHNAQWQIDTLVRQAGSDSHEYRTAASDLPLLLRESIEANIKGDALDAAAEAEAQKRGWRP